MADSPREPGTRDDRGTPRWVKALGLAAIVLVVLVVIVMLVGGGEHGPSRHTGFFEPRSVDVSGEAVTFR